MGEPDILAIVTSVFALFIRNKQNYKGDRHHFGPFYRIQYPEENYYFIGTELFGKDIFVRIGRL